MKKLFFTFAVAVLAFTACNNDNGNTPRGFLISTPAVTGGPAVGLSRLDVVANNGITDVLIKTAVVTNTGFSMTLPGKPSDLSALAPFYATAADVPMGVTISNLSAEYFQIEFRGFAGSIELGSLMYENTTTTTATEILYWYVDRKVSITGNYTADGLRTVYKLDLEKGWNRVVWVMDATNNTLTLTSILPGGTYVSWNFHPDAPLSLTLSDVEFTGIVTDLNTIVAYPLDFEDITIATATYTPGSSLFSITLPAVPSDLTALSPFFENVGDVPAGILTSDLAAQTFALGFRGNDVDGNLNGYLFNQTIDGSITTDILYVYVDRNVTITGSYTDDSTIITYNMRLRKGWNKVVQISNSANDTVKFTSPLPNGTNVGWVYELL